MSDQQLEQILTRLGGLEGTTGGVVRDVAVLKTDVAVLKTDVAVLKTDVKDLRRHMGVLHEEVLDRIKGIGEDDSLRREMRAGFAELQELFRDHAIPGDAFDKQCAMTLSGHERRLKTLEQAKKG